MTTPQGPPGGAPPPHRHWLVVAWPYARLGIEILLATALTVLLVAWATLNDRRFDLTPTKEHTLSDQGRRAATRLDRDVEITVFASSQEDERRRHVEDLLERFRRASPHVHWRVVDLDRNPSLAREFGVVNYFSGVLRGDGQTFRMRDVDEAEISTTLLRFVEGDERRVLFLVGHAEGDPSSADPRSGLSIAAKSLETENWKVLRSDDLGTDTPEGLALIVLVGPRSDLTPHEIAALDAHLQRGGGVLMLLEAPTPATVQEWLRPLGVVCGNDLIVDERNRLAGSDRTMVRVAVYNQAILDMSGAPPAVLPLAQSIVATDPTLPGCKAEPLALTGDDTWADPDRRSSAKAPPEFRQGRDRRGPVPVAAIASPGRQGATDRDGAVVVIGDADFATNLYIGLLGNRDLFLNLAALSARAEELVSVREAIEPGGTFSRVYLTDRQSRILFFWSVLVPPVAVALVGGWIAWRRRRRTAG